MSLMGVDLYIFAVHRYRDLLGSWVSSFGSYFEATKGKLSHNL